MVRATAFALLLLLPVTSAAESAVSLPVSQASCPRELPLTVRLFVDLECAYSRQAWPLYRKAFGPEVHVVVQHLPLSRHPLAMPAAVAAVAARAQGKELEFVDALMSDTNVDEAALAHAATTAGLDLQRWTAARQDRGLQAQVEREQQSGLAFGVQSTPSALVNGNGLAGVPSAAALRVALRTSERAAASVRSREGAGVDMERWTLVRSSPEHVPALDALRSGRALASATPAPPHGSLGQHWRVPVAANDLSWGPDSGITVVMFLDPANAAQRRDLAALFRLQAVEAKQGRGDIRLVVKLVLGSVLRSPGSDGSPLAMVLAAAALTGGERTSAFARTLLADPAAGTAWEQAASASGLDPQALKRTAEAPATAGWLQQSAALARSVGAESGAIFLNTQSWLGLATDDGLSAALARLRADLRPAGARAGTYAALVEQGTVMPAAETDLDSPEPLGELAGTAKLGNVGQPVYLFVDFASPHSRAAFYMLRRLVSSTARPIQLTIAPILPQGPDGVTVSGLSIVAAAQLGRTNELAEALFDAPKPNEWSTVYAILKKLRVDPVAFRKAVDSPQSRLPLRRVREAKLRLAMRDEPVIYIGERLYQGPLDEARLERAVQYVQEAPANPLRTRACSPP